MFGSTGVKYRQRARVDAAFQKIRNAMCLKFLVSHIRHSVPLIRPSSPYITVPMFSVARSAVDLAHEGRDPLFGQRWD